MSITHQEDSQDSSGDEVETAEDCYINAIAREVYKKIRDSSEGDDEWNITVTQYFDDAFESVSMTKIWRRFLLTLYGKELPINQQMISDIIGNKSGYKSPVLDAVLKLTAPPAWEDRDGSDDAQTDDETAQTDDETPAQTDTDDEADDDDY